MNLTCMHTKYHKLMCSLHVKTGPPDVDEVIYTPDIVYIYSDLYCMHTVIVYAVKNIIQ